MKPRAILIFSFISFLSGTFFTSGFFLSRSLLHTKLPTLRQKKRTTISIPQSIPSQLTSSWQGAELGSVSDIEDKLKPFIGTKKIKRAPSENIDKLKYDWLEPL